MGQGAIYLLTDRPDRSAALETLIKGIGRCEVVASGEDPAAGVSPQAIVSDLTLSRRESVSRLRAFVPRGKATEIPLVCLLRSTSDQDLRIARDLGATVCFPAYTAPHIVVQALIDQIAAVEPDPRVQPVVQGVSQATQVLTGLFDNVRDGGTVSLPQINAGLDPILSAVREGGLTRWLETVWTHDDATYQHCLLVAGVAAQFVLHLGFRTADREHFVRAALLHDVGKARIPREILNKPGRLTADEMTIMRTHPVIGYEILRDSQCDAATLGAVRHHHEMLDGSGYPDGLAGAEISDTVRLLTICDIYAALTERRSYKPPMPAREAMVILESMSGKLEMTLVQRFGDAMVAA
ncbi:HD domain-containing phosphohydrolase [Methylobacterium sp.]|jgi:putative nucleotidyltransferase with HDIG domain|uniref:HD-GYP domain-containing protein n=1 Tax=Methylobacterium sp. TaxID=409 RepID=UPI002623A038|nr:HD domain-containing phosphohydrolase [Methylobacterium sp.]MDB5647172.1 metal dependent phosphohydrolase [Methylobacterium sp.]